MGESTALALQNISKCYKRYSHPIDRLKEVLSPGRSRADQFWALQDINLEVARGETLGIVGQNGSGKSTLLQIIAGTLMPTTGQVWVNGRVSALLELGSGFNPEFTGRQNVFFNGQILGLTIPEIAAKFDAIAAFAEIGDFIDQPVKTYSSGMMVRLAFAVVANTEPTILIVDEALAVGDARFQARCMKRIRQLKEQGVTILFVSHDSSSVKMLCQRAVLLNHGRVIDAGKPKEVVNHYIALLSTDTSEIDSDITQVAFKEDLQNSNNSVVEHNNLSQLLHPHELDQDQNTKHRHGNQLATIKSVKIRDSNNRETDKIETATDFAIEVFLTAKAEITDLVVGISIRNLMGLVIYGTNTQLMDIPLPHLIANQSLKIVFRLPCHINKGVYTLTVGLHSEEGISYDWVDDLAIFEVFNGDSCDGITDLKATVEVTQSHYLLT